MKKVLITGGTGVIGTRLTEHLVRRGHYVAHLARSKGTGKTPVFHWEPRSNKIDKEAFKDIDTIVHLAGMDISSKRWNSRVKDEILFSRAGTARVLREHLEKHPNAVKTFISASGTSYYGTGNMGRAFVESDSPGTDFMARVTSLWEHEAEAFEGHGIRVVSVRTGMVLSPKASGLRKLAGPVRFFVGAPLGHGQQMTNWIHIDDVCGIYVKAIEEESMSGPYNAVAPHNASNKTLTHELARALKRPLWAPHVPGFLVRLIAGEVAYVVLEGGAVSPDKVVKAGYQFQYPALADALASIYREPAQ